jgi:hypothetical protein
MRQRSLTDEVTPLLTPTDCRKQRVPSKSAPGGQIIVDGWGGREQFEQVAAVESIQLFAEGEEQPIAAIPAAGVHDHGGVVGMPVGPVHAVDCTRLTALRRP